MHDLTRAALPAAALLFVSTSVLAQTDWRPVAEISTRWAHSTAYDSSSQRVLIFGGNQGRNDLWSWDGATWTLLNTPVAPSRRSHSTMAYDSVRQRMVLFGGQDKDGDFLADTWEWDGRGWQKMQPASSPGALAMSQMVYDSRRQRMLLFGGVTGRANYNFVFSDATWEWDGQNWSQLNPSTSPPARGMHAMCYDPQRGTTIVHGGWGQSDNLTDSWEFNGQSWSPISSATPPTVLRGAAMWFDPQRQEASLLGLNKWANGGITPAQELWTLAPQGWTKIAVAAPVLGQEVRLAFDSARGRGVILGMHKPETYEIAGGSLSSIPLPRRPVLPNAEYPVMAFDSTRRVSVLVTAPASLNPGTLETWEDAGSGWQLRSPANAPRGLEQLRGAYDSKRQRLVLTGAVVSARELQTWEYDGAAWQRVATTTAPPAADDYALVYDPLRAELVFIGSHFYWGDIEIWTYDGSQWTSEAPTTKMPSREITRAAWHPGRGSIMVLGGGSPSASNYTKSDFWEWDGSNWRQLAGNTPVGVITKHQMCYDPRRERLVVYGGQRTSSFYFSDTWEWDGQTWTKRGGAENPGQATQFAMSFDENQGRMRFFGTTSYPSWTYGAETPALVQDVGAGCPGTQGVPRLDGEGYPWLGASFVLALDRVRAQTPALLAVGASNTSWSGVSLPVDLGILGMSGCSLRVGLQVTLPLSVDSSGEARQSFAIPMQTSLLGSTAYVQAFAGDPGVNAAGITGSNALELQLGGR